VVVSAASGASPKAVSPDGMFLPTLNVWLSQNQWMSNNYSPGGATGPPPGLQTEYLCEKAELCSVQ